MCCQCICVASKLNQWTYECREATIFQFVMFISFIHCNIIQLHSFSAHFESDSVFPFYYNIFQSIFRFTVTQGKCIVLLSDPPHQQYLSHARWRFAVLIIVNCEGRQGDGTAWGDDAKTPLIILRTMTQV